MKDISLNTIERLIFYRRILLKLSIEGKTHIYSHEISNYIFNAAPQVRRDLMLIGCSATSRKGYNINNLIKKIGSAVDKNQIQKIALIGIDNLGRAILSYFSKKHSGLSIEAAFDSDKTKTNRVISNCKVYHISKLKTLVKKKGITIGIITEPAEFAQSTADLLMEAGIKAILNFSPVSINVNERIILDDLDITLILEKLAYRIN